jgi:hypothetical protein
MAGILSPLIIGELVKDADKRWRWFRIASVATLSCPKDSTPSASCRNGGKRSNAAADYRLSMTTFPTSSHPFTSPPLFVCPMKNQLDWLLMAVVNIVVLRITTKLREQAMFTGPREISCPAFRAIALGGVERQMVRQTCYSPTHKITGSVLSHGFQRLVSVGHRRIFARLDAVFACLRSRTIRRPYACRIELLVHWKSAATFPYAGKSDVRP